MNRMRITLVALALASAWAQAQAPAEPPVTGGAAPEPTQAEKLLRSEQAFQTRIGALTQVVDSLWKRVADARRSTLPMSPDELGRLERDIDVADREASDLTILSTAPLQQLQRNEQQDRISELRLILDALKRRWNAGGPVFGLSSFQGYPMLGGSANRPVPENYVVHPGDRLSVVVSSKLGADKEYRPVVDRFGYALIPGAGRLPAAGMTASHLQKSLTARIAKRFPQLRVEVSVESVAGISVQVIGEVARPGSYLLDSSGTLVDALRQAGGITETGSFRKVEVRRGAGKPLRADLYRLLLSGNRSADLPLKSGDLIFVPTVGPTLTISGEVVRPRRYEPSFPLNLAEALKMAGGTKAGANTHNVQVERVVDGEFRVLLNEKVAKDRPAGEFALLPGDEVTVTTVYADQTNKVSVSGPVKAPGVYGYTEGMTVKDLIALAQGISPEMEVYGGRADILRFSPLREARIVTVNLDKAMAGDPADNVPLQRYDRLFLYEPDQVEFRPRVVKVEGALARPGTYRRKDGMHVSDVVAAAGGLLPEAHLERANLVRALPDDKTEIVPVNLKAALSGDPTANLELKDRDKLTVFTRAEAVWQNRTVRVEGAVQRPGLYERSQNMKLSDLLFTSGGVLPDAAPNVQIARVLPDGTTQLLSVDLAALRNGATPDPLLSDRDVLAVPFVNAYNRTPDVVYLTGEVVHPGPYALQSRKERLSDLIARAGGLTDVADKRGALFLRRREGLESETQDAEADRLLQHSRLMADREFVMQLAKMGLPNAGAAPGTPISTEKPIDNAPKTVGGEAHDKSEVGPGEGGPQPRTQGKEGAPGGALGPPIAGPDKQKSAQDRAQENAALLAGAVRISVDLEKALEKQAGGNDLTLTDGDRIFIPKASNVVTVLGAVLHPHRMVGLLGKSADWYIKQSGGYAQDAAPRYAVVIRRNGDAMPARDVKSVEPGDIIVVPTTGLIDVTRKIEKVQDVTRVVADVLSSLFIITKL